MVGFLNRRSTYQRLLDTGLTPSPMVEPASANPCSRRHLRSQQGSRIDAFLAISEIGVDELLAMIADDFTTANL